MQGQETARFRSFSSRATRGAPHAARVPPAASLVSALSAHVHSVSRSDLDVRRLTRPGQARPQPPKSGSAGGAFSCTVSGRLLSPCCPVRLMQFSSLRVTPWSLHMPEELRRCGAICFHEHHSPRRNSQTPSNSLTPVDPCTRSHAEPEQDQVGSMPSAESQTSFGDVGGGLPRPL